MVCCRAESWNVRDRHMAEPLDRLLAHHGPASKAVVRPLHVRLQEEGEVPETYPTGV